MHFFVVLLPDTPTVDFKSSNQAVIEVQTFRFNSRGLTKLLHYLFRIYISGIVLFGN